MGLIKVNKKWYSFESLTEIDKMRLGLSPELSEKIVKDDLDQLKEDLEKIPESVKKTHVKKQKKERKYKED